MKQETRTVVYDDELRLEAYRFEGTRQPFPSHFHEMVMKGIGDFGKEETLLFLISLLIQNYGQAFERCIPECRQEITFVLVGLCGIRLYVIIYFVCENKYKEESWSRFH